MVKGLMKSHGNHGGYGARSCSHGTGACDWSPCGYPLCPALSLSFPDMLWKGVTLFRNQEIHRSLMVGTWNGRVQRVTVTPQKAKERGGHQRIVRYFESSLSEGVLPLLASPAGDGEDGEQDTPVELGSLEQPCQCYH